MDEEGYQKELFEFSDTPRKSFPRLGKFLPRADFEGKISFTFTLDRLIFIAIGIILAMVIVFAAGVERGRSVAIDALKEFTIVTASEKPPATAAVKPVPQAAAPVIASPEKIEPEVVPPSTTKPYTIVAAAFKGASSASQVAEQLKKTGLPAHVTENAPYFVVCVGGYDSRAAADTDFTRTKKIYKDAYIKLR